MGLTGDVHGATQVNDSGASKDDDGIVGKGGGESKRGGRSLIRVHVSAALLPSVLLCLASSGALATIGLLLLLLASLLLLLELGVP